MKIIISEKIPKINFFSNIYYIFIIQILSKDLRPGIGKICEKVMKIFQ